jgi:hypothetical protein
MSTLFDIETSTKKFSDARTNLGDLVQSLNDGIELMKRDYMTKIKKAVVVAAEKKADLHALISESQDLFVKPRTVIFHGIKVGMAKGKGSIEWEDESVVVKLIKKHFPDEVDKLIKTTEKPIKKNMADLSASDLKKIGVQVEECGDIVYIKATDSEVDKIVNALLKDSEEELETSGN